MNATQIDAKEELGAVIWDLYKDVYGVRPRHMDFNSMSMDELEQLFQTLQVDLEREEANRKEDEKLSVIDFEDQVARIMAMGAGDRKTALKWIMEGSCCNGDWEFLAYRNGLPYTYFKAEVAA